MKEIILDFQEVDLPICISRRIDVTSVAGKATVCIGVRRSGKSVFMFQRIQRLLNVGVLRQNILYLNFFDDRLHSLLPTGWWITPPPCIPSTILLAT
ncbi:MAG: AAA family ATPase [Chlorobium sp.]